MKLPLLVVAVPTLVLWQGAAIGGLSVAGKGRQPITTLMAAGDNDRCENNTASSVQLSSVQFSSDGPNMSPGKTPTLTDQYWTGTISVSARTPTLSACRLFSLSLLCFVMAADTRSERVDHRANIEHASIPSLGEPPTPGERVQWSPLYMAPSDPTFVSTRVRVDRPTLFLYFSQKAKTRAAVGTFPRQRPDRQQTSLLTSPLVLFPE